MNDYIGVLLGGLLAIFPSLFILLVDMWKFKKNQNQELYLKYFELYKVEKNKALLEYVHLLGAISSKNLGAEFSLDKYFAAAQKASCFVPKEIRTMINSANDIAYNWESKKSHTALSAITDDLTEAIFQELASDFRKVDNHF
jgi:hypothetical protein